MSINRFKLYKMQKHTRMFNKTRLTFLSIDVVKKVDGILHYAVTHIAEIPGIINNEVTHNKTAFLGAQDMYVCRLMSPLVMHISG